MESAQKTAISNSKMLQILCKGFSGCQSHQFHLTFKQSSKQVKDVYIVMMIMINDHLMICYDDDDDDADNKK